MTLKADRAVRIGGKTFKRGQSIEGVTPSQMKYLHDHGYASGEVPDETQVVVELNDMTVSQLKDYAANKNIDLGDATKKADIVAAIQLAIEPVAT